MKQLLIYFLPTLLCMYKPGSGDKREMDSTTCKKGLTGC